MGLRRSWLTRLFGASSIALVVPATLIGVVVLVGLVGGFAGLPDVKQLVAGPTLSTLPGAASASTSGDRPSLAGLLGVQGSAGHTGASGHSPSSRHPGSAASAPGPKLIPRSGGEPGLSSGSPGIRRRQSTQPGMPPAPRAHPVRSTSSGHPRGAGAPRPSSGSSGALSQAAVAVAQSAARGVAALAGTVATVADTAPSPAGPLVAGVGESVGATAAKLLDGASPQGGG